MKSKQLRHAMLEGALARLDRLARRRDRREKPDHLRVGTQGEDAAFFELLRKGYTVVGRRWAAGNIAGDVDLIAWHGPQLCFIEVKTRTARDMSPAESAVDRQKRQTLRRLAHAYIRQLPGSEPPPVRFDVMSVYLVPGKEKQIEHFEAAYGWDERGEWVE